MKTKKKLNRNEKIAIEKKWLSFFLGLFLISCFSGAILSMPLDFYYWIQINIIGHTLVSSILFLPFIFYTYIHFRRTIGVRQPLLLLNGLLLNVTLIGLFFSGFWISFNGQNESDTWIASSHFILSYLTILLIVLHVINHWINRKKQFKKKNIINQDFFLTLPKKLSLRFFSIISCYIFIVSSCVFVYFSYIQATENIVANNKEKYLYAYGSHPFRPSQTETVSNNFIKTEQITKSKQCGSCHIDIYEQWLSSTHRQAASDPTYVKNINLLEANRGISATRYCEGCHAPVALLTGQLTPGGEHGGVPDTPAHLEGVGCMGCHGISNIVHLNGTASYEFDPKEHYLFDSGTSFSKQKIRNFLIRLNPEPHKNAMGPELMQDPKLCASCHEQFMDESMNNWGWVKMQSEYTHWLASPFSGQNEKNFQNENIMTCQTCHFPLVRGSDPSADQNGMIHSHRSLGANTVLPWLKGDTEQLEATIDFLTSAKLLVDIEEPSRADSIQNSQFVNQELRPLNSDNSPFFLYLGEESTIRVTVTNRMVGHAFPAGTTDINQAWLYLSVKDAGNQIIYESGKLNDALEVDPTAHIYHSIPVDRQGKHVWKHDLFRMVGETYRNVIPSGKTDIKDYTFKVPSWAEEPLTITAILKYRKFNQKYARWALNHPKPVLPIVDMARDSLTIPLKIKPVIE